MHAECTRHASNLNLPADPSLGTNEAGAHFYREAQHAIVFAGSGVLVMLCGSWDTRSGGGYVNVVCEKQLSSVAAE